MRRGHTHLRMRIYHIDIITGLTIANVIEVVSIEKLLKFYH